MPLLQQAQRITVQRETSVGSTTAVEQNAITVTAETSGSVTGYASTHGSLSASTFTLDGSTYTIEQLLSQNNQLELRLDRALPFGVQVELVISADTHTFNVEAATIEAVSSDFLYTWDLTNLSAGSWTLNIRQVASAVMPLAISDWTTDIQQGRDERSDYTGSGLRPRGVETQRIVTVSFSTVLAWYGDTYHGIRSALTDLLGACALYGTPLDTTEAYQYHQALPDLALASQIIGSSVAIVYDDGRNHYNFTGARGDVTLAFPPGSSVRLNFTLKGHMTETPAQNATRLASPEFAIARGSQRSDITITTSGNSPAAVPHDEVTSFELALGNSYDAPPSMSGDGYGDVQINGREPMITMNLLISATTGDHPPGYEGLLEDVAHRVTASIDDGGGDTALGLEIIADPLETTQVGDASDQSLLAKGLTLAVREAASPLEFRWTGGRT